MSTSNGTFSLAAVVIILSIDYLTLLFFLGSSNRCSVPIQYRRRFSVGRWLWVLARIPCHSNSTARGTVNWTAFSMVSLISPLACSMYPSGHVNHIPSWSSSTISTGRLSLLKALSRSKTLFLKTSASSICTTAFAAWRFSLAVSWSEFARLRLRARMLPTVRFQTDETGRF
jgi:hypothetical protein